MREPCHLATIIPGAGWKLAHQKTTTTHSIWKTHWAERGMVPDRYSEAVFELLVPDNQRLNVTLRVDDDGVAHRCEVPSDSAIAYDASDRTEFRFAGDFTTWGYNRENHFHGPDPLSAIQGIREPVITLQAGPAAFFALHEADLRQGEPLAL